MCQARFFKNHWVTVDQKRLSKFEAALNLIRDDALKVQFQALYNHLNDNTQLKSLGSHTRSVTNTILDDFTELANKVNNSCARDNNYMTKFDKYWDRFEVNTKLRIAIVGILSLITFGTLAAIFVFAPPAALTLAAVGIALGKAAIYSGLVAGAMSLFSIGCAGEKSMALKGQKGKTIAKLTNIVTAITSKKEEYKRVRSMT